MNILRLLLRQGAILCLIFIFVLPICSNTHTNLYIQYQSPVAGALYVSPATNIILRLNNMIDKSAIASPSVFTITGSKSGFHTGNIKLAADRSTILFKPDEPFSEGEHVTVTLKNGIQTEAGEILKPLSFTFTIGVMNNNSSKIKIFDGELQDEVTIPTTPFSYQSPKVSGDTLPLDFPYLGSTISGTTAPGKILISNLSFTGPVVPYLMIFENSGIPIFYRKMKTVCTDFKVQPNGLLTYFDTGLKKYYAMDSLYTVVDSFMTGNGYITDIHELRLLPNGHALLLSYDPQTVDMSGITPGGKSNATVTGLILQEIDEQKGVVFQWRSWDHFQITDATHEDLTAAAIDYVHGNAIELDTDGNLLLSSRHMDEITKINRQTGEIIWRMGGKNNQFTFINDSIGFSHQHAIRRLLNGNVILYDNGNFHSTPFSRAVEYQLDEEAKTTTLVWQYRHTPDIYGTAMGYAQRLDNGNTLIGWGAANPSVTEVRADGSVVYELTLADGIYSYRAFRFPWKEKNSVSPNNSPESYSLFQNYPNPFNNSTKILISLPQEEIVSFKIYDALGRLISTQIEKERKSPGFFFVTFDGTYLTSGEYFYRLITGHSDQTRKMLLIK